MEELLSGMLLYRGAAEDPLLRSLCAPGAALRERQSQLPRLLAFAEENAVSGNLWQTYLTWRILNDENPWALACEGRGDPGGSLSRLARGDMERFRRLLHLELPPLAQELRGELLNYEPGAGRSPSPAVARLCRLRDRLVSAHYADELLSRCAEAYREMGVGDFALCAAFRAGEHGSLTPIRDMAAAPLSALVGYEDQKRLLRENTAAFLAGRESNHVLLYGDAGTGKSTCVRALLTEFEGSALRLVELRRAHFEALPELLAALRRRRCRFLLFIDDLSFEEHETEYKHLKAAIEGGLETMPENVRVCATSNRRHLIRETWSDRSDMEHDGDLHRSDTVEEKLSLAGRFGLTIRFDSPDRRLYYEIVERLAAEQSLDLKTEDLHRRADAWAIRHGGLSGRTAKQFVDAASGQATSNVTIQ